MLKEKIDDLVDIITEEYSRIENTFLIRNNQQLIKYVENPAKWKAEQIAHRNAYKKELVREAQNRLAILNAKAEKVLLLSYQEVDKDIIKISETEIEVNEKFKDEIEGRIKELRQKNELAVKVLANESFKTYERTVRLISYTSNADNLFEVIKRQMPKGIENGIKVAYKNGREMNWKSYMEMDTRTTLQTETSARQIQAGALAGQIFYVCDSFADCAKDHADYQGKIYYNAEAKLTKEAEDYIRANGIKSMQEVRDGEPYLTTRPNCRHNFHAVPTDTVVSGTPASKIVEQEGFKFGEYKDSNYKDLQQQRYNERKIREWKTRLENERQIAKTTGIPNPKAEAQARHKVSEWQGKQRELINSNPEVLQRNYDRESAKIVVEDLGVRYRYKVIDGELVKKK